ncbi:MAG: hypothetical protein PHO02_04855 [Candidatus Nanoarchaeia archaeon]|nr:hypothetical protein [Candidatus Nanoarchaeia archaeon]
MADILVVRVLGATLMSIALFISAMKRNARIAIALIVISMAMFYLLSQA